VTVYDFDPAKRQPGFYKRMYSGGNKSKLPCPICGARMNATGMAMHLKAHAKGSTRIQKPK
jgi:hypothetical protein